MGFIRLFINNDFFYIINGIGWLWKFDDEFIFECYVIVDWDDFVWVVSYIFNYGVLGILKKFM